MDPLVLEVEETLRSLSLKKESYSEALQSFLVIKESIVCRHELCTIPRFIELAFQATERLLSGSGQGGMQTAKDQKALSGLLVLQKRLLGVLDMNILGASYLAISQVIIDRLVNTLLTVSRSGDASVETFHVTSALKQFCSVLDSIQLKPRVFASLVDAFLHARVPERHKAEILVCIVGLLSKAQDNSLAVLSVHRLALHHVSMHGQRQLDASKGHVVEQFEQTLTPVSNLYFSLIGFFEKSQVQEYLDALLQLCTLKQQRFSSMCAFECLASQVALLEATAPGGRHAWIPVYTLENLTSKFRETKDAQVVQAYLCTCTSCLSYVLHNAAEEDSQHADVQASLDAFVLSLRHFMFTSDSSIHSAVINSLAELVLKAKTDLARRPEPEGSLFRHALLELAVSRLLPFCSSVLEDYRYKLSWQELLRLLIVMIESWDELAVASCCRDGTLELLTAKRSAGTELFEHVICKSLSMASIALCGASDRSSLEYRDLSRMKEELRRIVGSITRAFGPKLVLKYMPLRFSGVELTDREFAAKSNSWLLPLLRVHITRTHISFFVEHFLPIALELNSYCSEHQATQPNYARLYSILEEQIWALLPGFFDEPLDLAETFGSNQGKIRLHMLQLLDQPGTRNHICNALLRISRQAFIGRGLSNDKEDEFRDARKMSNIDNRSYHVAVKTWRENTQVLAVHSKAFLSLLIVKFLSCNSESVVEAQSDLAKEQESQHYLACIQNLVPFCDESVLQTNLKNFYAVWENLAQGVESSKLPFSCGKIIALLDVAIMMFKRISVDKVNSIMHYFTRLLKVILTQDAKKHFNERAALLRRLYKGLRVGLETLGDRTLALSGLEDQLSHLWEILVLDSGKCPVNSLKHRLSCLRAFVQLLNKVEDREFVSSFGADRVINHLIPEILFSAREPNTTVRTNAMALLKSLIECNLESDQFLETIIVKIITLSQINTERLDDGYIGVSCIISLSRIIFDYGDLIQQRLPIASNSTLQLIINFIVHSLNSENPLIYLNGLKSVKVCLFRLDADIMWNYIPLIISNALGNQHCALKFRMHVRKVLISVIKKFGPEKALEAFPTQHTQLYRYLIRKMNRSARKKTSRKSQDTFDSIMYDELETGEAGSGSFEDQEDFSSDEELPPSHMRERSSGAGLSQTGWNASSKQRSKSKSLTIIDDGNSSALGPIDLLSSEASSRILGAQPSARVVGRRDDTNDGTVEFDKALNKIVVSEETKPGDADSADRDLEAGPGALSLATRQGLKLHKIAPTSRLNNKRREKKSRKQHVIVKSAKDFKGKKAQGDVYKHGVQPFAYMRLNPAISKEKHRLSATKSLSAMFRKTR